MGDDNEKRVTSQLWKFNKHCDKKFQSSIPKGVNKVKRGKKLKTLFLGWIFVLNLTATSMKFGQVVLFSDVEGCS